MVAETILTPLRFHCASFRSWSNGIQERNIINALIITAPVSICSKEIKELWSLGIKSVLLFIKCRG